MRNARYACAGRGKLGACGMVMPEAGGIPGSLFATSFITVPLLHPKASRDFHDLQQSACCKNSHCVPCVELTRMLCLHFAGGGLPLYLGLQGCNSPKCTLSQNGYGGGRVMVMMVRGREE